MEADQWKRIGVMSLVWTRVNIKRAEAIVRELQQSSRESESNRQERAEAIVRELQQSSRESESNRQERAEAIVRELQQSSRESESNR